MTKDCDLHMHSHFSDGSDSPTELVKKAKALGMRAIALTDHNNVDGIPEAMKAGLEHGIEVVPGCEFQSLWGEVVGYFFDYTSKDIEELNRDTHQRKADRIKKYVENLKAIGLKIDYETLKKEQEGAIHRPHLAKMLVAQGLASDIKDAFDRFLGDSGSCFVPVEYPDIHLVIKTIRNAGGVAVLAHPWIEKWEKEFADIDNLIKAGLVGIEIETGPNVKGEEEDAIKERIKKICTEKGLIMTRGSDYHGENKKTKLGEHNCEYSIIEQLKEKVKELDKR